MIIYLASGNRHKHRELSAVFPGHRIRLPAEAGIEGFDPAESGSSFMENALGKARALRDLLVLRVPGPAGDCAVLADDSGLCVDVLNGRPGIYSARYRGPDTWKNGSAEQSGGAVPRGPPAVPPAAKLSDQERNVLLLEEIRAALEAQDGGAGVKRRCRFVCAMVLTLGPNRFYAVQETLEGEVVQSPAAMKGAGGFGYDPLVYLPEMGRTVAELSEEEKNRYSHRGKAGRALAQLLPDSSG
jgi:XTP/dITP diphosphohydrolase